MIRLLSLFSGIGAFEKALTNLNEEFEVVNYCEIDKTASKAYSLIHNISEEKNLQDVCTINTTNFDNIDLITYGFPCQDISIAGKQKGFADEEGNTTRSGLFFEAVRIIKDIQPRFAIAENVGALTSVKFENEFKIVFDTLYDAGYESYWQVLNAKDFGIPQNRERVFIVSIRKDINHGFVFPKKQPLHKLLRDLLEQDVNKKYYLSEDQKKNFNITNSDYLMIDRTMLYSENKCRGYNDISRSLQAHDSKEPLFVNESKLKEQPVCIGGLGEINWGTQHHQQDRIYDGNAIAMALPAQLPHGSYIYAFDTCVQIGSLDRPKIHEFSNRVYSPDGCARTLMGEGGNCNDKAGQYLIRRLTPKECFRLMGFSDEDCDVLKQNGISDTQIYKMAGNSIVVNVLEAIFTQLINQYRYNKIEDAANTQMTFDEYLWLNKET